MSCFVPNCTNSVGVPFPQDTIARKLWLENLNLTNTPTTESFICLDHFDPSDLINDSETASSSRIKSTAVPCVINQNHEVQECTGDEIKACRLCDSKTDLEKTIYDPLEDDEPIMLVIALCCYPVVISTDDNLPKYICTTCLEQLRRSHKLRQKCLQVYEKYSQKSERLENNKNKASSIEIEDMPPLKYIKTERKEYENINDYTNKEEKTTEKSKNPHLFIQLDDPPPLVAIERKPNLDIKKYDEIERNLEEIHGMSKNDKPLKTPKEKLKNCIKINIKNQPPKVVKLPRGIRVTQPEICKSQTGVFPCTLTYGLQDSIFVMADEYMFTFGLLKGTTRFLHCVVPSCKANAVQKHLEDGTYEKLIFVKVPHNHRPPSDQMRKKHVFLHVMRKRMQLDKTLNIRSIYEEICKHEPEIKTLVPLRSVINEICRNQVSNKVPMISTFEEFYNRIENEEFEKLHFTNSNKQFYQERFSCDDGSLAVLFCNTDITNQISDNKLMYVDASFKIDTTEEFNYQLVTVLVWVDDSYYPILYALVNKKSQEIFKKVFKHLHDVLAPNLRPHEIVTDYESSLYYALGETYLNSHIGGSVFYYTLNLYKKICSLNLSRDLETNSNFRNMYHMLLMLPLLPVNTILDALSNIEIQARDLGLRELARPILDHIRNQWILHVTPELFCVHRLENRINENVIAPFKKLRDFLLLFKGKVSQTQITVAQVVEKLIELESYLHNIYTKEDKRSFGRDLSSFQKKNVVRAWQFIETHPKINVNNFFQKVIGYIKCMENQLWIWGFYRYTGDADDVLINASNFSIIVGEDVEVDNINEDFVEDVPVEENVLLEESIQLEENVPFEENVLSNDVEGNPTIVMEAVIDNDGGVVLQTNEADDSKQFEKAFLKYVHYQ